MPTTLLLPHCAQFRFEAHYTEEEGCSTEGPAIMGPAGGLASAAVSELLERSVFIREGGFNGEGRGVGVGVRGG